MTPDRKMDMNKPPESSSKPLIPQFRPYVDKSDYAYLERVFEHHHIAEGRYAKEFQQQLLNIIGSRYGCFASNGTLALYLALRAAGIKPGDEVIVQDITFVASANAVEMVGARPVFADIREYNDITIDLERVKISENTKAMIVCPLFGTACGNIEQIVTFCRTHNIILVEDAAQALAIRGASGHCGTFGTVGTFSFYADKIITTGEGGFVVTNDETVYERMLYLRNQGRKKNGTFVHPEIGFNFRITDIQACLGLSQLQKLETIIREKQKIYAAYRSSLGDSVEYLLLRDDFTHIPFRVVIFVEDAERVVKCLAQKGIELRSMFYPLHMQPCYRHLGYPDSNYPNSMACFKKGICLPTWVGLSEKQIYQVAEAVREALKSQV